MNLSKKTFGLLVAISCCMNTFAQQAVSLTKNQEKNQIDVTIGGQPFTSLRYGASLEKPVLYPVFANNNIDVTRGFPLNPKKDDPTDHPHHIGIWFNFENLNGLDFWNNSYAIPAAKKSQYGWIKTDPNITFSSGKTGKLSYQARWTNQADETLLDEKTQLEFSVMGNQRIIDRVTILTAKVDATFTDAKDGMLGIRLAHELQIPTTKDQKFSDDKGIVTVVKGGTDKIANGDYLTSAGKKGDDAWSTRANWCVAFGKMNNQMVSVAIIDHPKNVNYPTFWHARGYGLFAANPLGEKIFTNGASAKNLALKKGESVTFKYRVVVQANDTALGATELDKLAAAFARK